MSTREIKISTSYGHLAIKVWNEYGQKTPILALHGWMDNAGTWDNLCPLIDNDYPIYALDFPGSGLSSHPPTDVGNYFTDHLVIVHKLILLGHSMGGAVSLLFAGAFPDKIEKIISIDTHVLYSADARDQRLHTITSLKELSKAAKRQVTQYPHYEYNEIIQKLVESYGGSLNEDAAKTLLIRNSVRHEDGKFSFTHSPVLKVRNTLSLNFEQLFSFLSKITCDLLIIKATDSPFHGRKTRNKKVFNSYKKTSSNFVFEVLDGGHHLHLITPHPIAEVINRFLYDQAQSKHIKVWNEYGQKTPILALHGWMDNAGTWDNLCPLIDNDYPIYALDFPGCGLSSHPSTDLGYYLMDNLVTVYNVINHFNWKKVNMGGATSLEYAGAFPYKIEKVISIDVHQPLSADVRGQCLRTVASLRDLSKAAEKQVSQNPHYEYKEIVQKLVESYGGNLNEDAAKTLLIRNSVMHEDGKFSFTYAPVLKVQKTLSLSFEQAFSFSSNITCDLLIIKAANTVLYGKKSNNKKVFNSYKKTSSNFVFEVLDGGHHLHLITPHPVAEVINRFLYDQAQSKHIKVWNEYGQKTPILALHGWMDNAGTWDNLCPLIDNDYPIYALDFPGSGLSSHPPNDVGTYFTDLLVTVDKVINHFKWKKLILLGHSMGGATSLLYAGAFPDKIEKVISIDSFRPITAEASEQCSVTARSLRELSKAAKKQVSQNPRYEYNEIVQKLVESYGADSPFHGRKTNNKKLFNSYKKTSSNFVFEVLDGGHHLHLITPHPVAEVINRFLYDQAQNKLKVWNEYGQKTPILALHGWMDNAGTWDNLCPLIDNDYPIYALDFPGCGLSSHPSTNLGHYFMDNLVTVHKVISHFNWKKLILLGHSMGGATSILYAGAFPDKIEKVISIDSRNLFTGDAKDQCVRTVTSLKELSKAAEKQVSQNPRYEYNEIVQKLVESYGGNLNEDAAKTLLIRNSVRHEDGKFSFTHSPVLKVNYTLTPSFEQAFTFISNITCDLLIIKATTTVLRGKRANIKKVFNSFKKTSSNFVFEVLEGRHHLHLVTPHPVAEVINRFLYDRAQSKSSKEFLLSKL
ncbi:putative serine hydrolase [Armadillidium vulgare]|nr:putative serine hydrolase [Armadillidium vulgare]